jgi:AMP-polyphosphate phosphotransferase
VSAATQLKRLRKLQRDKATRWRVTSEDRWMSRHYAQVERAFERCLDATQQAASPWHLIDGTDRQHRALEVGRRLLDGIQAQLPTQSSPRARHERVPGTALTTAHRGRGPGDDEYEAALERLRGRLAILSRRKKFAHHSVVAVFEGMDASGKGGAIRRITSALDARHYRVVPVAAPTADEIARPYLWRFWCHLPPRCNYTIFDRSWYGRVLVERVREFAPRADWERAYGEINEFERQLTEHGIVVPKFWLAVSAKQQLERFNERDRNPLKRFKVDPEDWVNRKHWDAYQDAVREMLARTSTPHAPWHVIPADDKRYARLAVLRILSEQIAATLD